MNTQIENPQAEKFQYTPFGVSRFTIKRINGRRDWESHLFLPRRCDVLTQKLFQRGTFDVVGFVGVADREFEFYRPTPLPSTVEVIRERVSKKPKDIAKELGAKPEIINLKEDVLTPIGKNLFARKTRDGTIEIFEEI